MREIIIGSKENRRYFIGFFATKGTKAKFFLLMDLTRFHNLAPTYLNRELKTHVVLGRKCLFVGLF